MNYDTLLELKNLGFPQAPSIVTGGNDGDILVGFYLVGKQDSDAAIHLTTEEWTKQVAAQGDIVVKVPTLAELLAACEASITDEQVVLVSFGKQLKEDGKTWGYWARIDTGNGKLGGESDASYEAAAADLYRTLNIIA